jgi:hypothetical protein
LLSGVFSNETHKEAKGRETVDRQIFMVVVDSMTKLRLMSQQEFHFQHAFPQSSRPQRFFTPTTAIHPCDETDIIM